MTGAPEDAADRREGRGRLSSIDLLPEEAEPDIVWANEQLRKAKLPQTAILIEFNERLADRGIEPISKSAFSRHAVRKAIAFRKMDRAREVSAEVVEQLGPAGADEMTVMVAEMLKLVAFEILEKGKVTSKQALELGRMLQSVTGSQKISADYRRKLQDEGREKLDAAIDKAAGEGAEGASAAEVLKRIRADVYGIVDR